MKRRSILLGLGGLAGVGGVAGTGAFTSASVERPVSVAVADDDQAYLKLLPADTIYGDLYASLNDGQLELDFDGNGRGDGLGTDSEYNFDDVFTITNQGTQPVYVWAEFDTSNFGNGTAWLYPGSDSQTRLNDGQNSVVQLAVGETLHVGIHIDTTGVDVQSGEYTLDATIHANANLPGSSSTPSNPGSGPFAPVTLSTGTAEWMVTEVPQSASLMTPVEAEPVASVPGAWTTSSCASWIDPFPDDADGLDGDPGGLYEYELTFEASSDVDTLVIEEYGSDNPVEFFLDGTSIGGSGGDNAFAELKSNMGPQSGLGPGQHTLRAEVTNNGSDTYGNPTGLLVCARVE